MILMHKRLLLIVSFVLLAGLSGSAAADPPAGEILKSSDIARGGGLPGIIWNVHLVSKDSDVEQIRELIVKAANRDSLVEFLAPSKVKGQKMLTVGRNMWFVQPGLQKPVPISPRQRLTGQASNGDIAATDYSGDYTATLMEQETVAGENCYVLDLHANNKAATYDRIVYWVSKARFVGLKAEFYTVSGKKLKTATLEYHNRIEYQGRNVPFVSRMVILDALNPSNVTTMEYSNVRAARIPAAEFNINLLTN
jgi:outer membrane lipoprotein-sorting protein